MRVGCPGTSPLQTKYLNQKGRIFMGMVSCLVADDFTNIIIILVIIMEINIKGMSNLRKSS